MAGGKENDSIRNISEIRLQEPVVRQCPECATEIILEAGSMDCELQACPDCGYELETAFFNPEDPAVVQKILSRAIKQGSKDGGTYDSSKLDLTQSPALIPSPQEGEDFGE